MRRLSFFSGFYEGFGRWRPGVLTGVFFSLLLVVLFSFQTFASELFLFDSVAIQSQMQNTLLQENFDDGTADGFGNESGDWKVIDNKYTATTGQFRFSTAGDLNWQNYVIEADYINAQDGGLLVRAQDFNNCISLVIRPAHNDIGFNIRKDGAWGPALATVPLGFQPGSTLHVKIEVSGEDIKGYINGQIKSLIKTTEFPRGKIGLYLFFQANQYWDNVVVYGAQPTPSPTPSVSSGLVAYYPFDSDYQDKSGNVNHGTLKGNIPFVTAAIGNGAKFDGKSWLEVNDNNSLDLSNACTFSAWINKENAGVGGWSVILEKADSPAMDNRSPYGFAHSSDGYYPLVNFAYNNQLTSIVSNTRTNFKEWYFVTVSWDGATVRFYVNGVLKDTKPWANPLPNSTSKLLIGCGPVGSTEYFVGILDDLRIYNYAINQQEIESLFQQGKQVLSLSPTPSIAPTPTTGALPAPTANPVNSSLVVAFESRSGQNGESVQVPVTIKSAEKVGNLDLTLSFNPAVLKATGISQGSLTAKSLFEQNIIEGTIKISLTDNLGITGEGTVAFVTFSVIGQAGSSSPLTIKEALLNRQGDSAALTASKISGTFTVLAAKKGDGNGDGKITELDALEALKMAVGKRALDLLLDVDGDAKVTSTDARMILRAALNLEVLR